MIIIFNIITIIVFIIILGYPLNEIRQYFFYKYQKKVILKGDWVANNKIYIGFAMLITAIITYLCYVNNWIELSNNEWIQLFVFISLPAIANLGLGILRPSLYDEGIWSFNGFLYWNQINSFSIENDIVILHIDLYIYKDIIFKGTINQINDLLNILHENEISKNY